MFPFSIVLIKVRLNPIKIGHLIALLIFFRVGTTDADPEDQVPVCLSCGNDACEYVRAAFSANANYYFKTCAGPDIPSFTLEWTGEEKSKSVSNKL